MTYSDENVDRLLENIKLFTRHKCEIRCNSKLNTALALYCGLDFIQLQSVQIDSLLLCELFYQVSSRHVNQETLGLFFDTIRVCTHTQEQT